MLRITREELETFFCLPYSDRQLVRFADDDISVESEVLGLVHPLASSTGPSAAAGAIAAALGPFSLIAGGMAYVAKKALEASSEAREKRQDITQNITMVPASLKDYFRLPLGHPRKRILYAAHPCLATLYIPVADFHRAVFESKSLEIISILTHLGAKSIRVAHESGWDKEFSGKVSLGIPSAGIAAGGDGGNNDLKKILYQANFRGTDNPTLPENLIWFKQEPTWQQVYDGRIKFGMQSFSLELQYKEDYGVNLGLKAEAENIGLDLGGKFEKHVATTWSIQGEF